MSGIEPTPRFVDTGPCYARFDTDDAQHDRTTGLFESIRTGDHPYRPVHTSWYILAETTRLLLYPVSHEGGTTVLATIRQSELSTILAVDHERFERACEQFRQYDDQEITLVDHLSGVLADLYGTVCAAAMPTWNGDDDRWSAPYRRNLVPRGITGEQRVRPATSLEEGRQFVGLDVFISQFW